MLKTINLESFRSGSGHLLATGQQSKPPRHKRGEKFLKGPVPLNWLTTAAQLPGKALHVSVELWFQAGLKESRHIKLSTAHLLKYGVKRNSIYRALEKLEAAHLISVKRHRGRLAVVTLLDVAIDESAKRQNSSFGARRGQPP
jgi:hypothetical protein